MTLPYKDGFTSSIITLSSATLCTSISLGPRDWG